MSDDRKPTPIRPNLGGRSRLLPSRAELWASSDLVAAVLLAIIAAVLAILPPDHARIRMALAAPLVLALPGYALVAAGFAFAALGLAERIVLSVGASLALAVLGGFVLNWLPWGLQAATWAALFAGITVLAALAALLCRRYGRATAPGEASEVPERPRVRLSIAQCATFGLAAVVLISAVGLSRAGALTQHQRGFTQLWALPGDGPANQLRLGIQCQEANPVAYLLRLEVSGTVLEEWSPVQLAPGERWEASGVALPPPDRSGPTAVQAVLYRLDAPDVVYRQVTVWQ